MITQAGPVPASHAHDEHAHEHAHDEHAHDEHAHDEYAHDEHAHEHAHEDGDAEQDTQKAMLGDCPDGVWVHNPPWGLVCPSAKRAKVCTALPPPATYGPAP